MKAATIALAAVLSVTGIATPEPADEGLAKLDQLAWLAGCWGTGDGTASADECWLERRGDTMIGFHIDVFSNGSVFYEYLRIVAKDDSLAYMASPLGREPTAFILVEIAPRRVVFENPAHDWPQRLTYWFDGDELHALAEGLDPESRKAEWVWVRTGQ